MGQRKNHAELLPGAIDMIDKTPIADLARLIRDASCVISPPSGVIHLAAAFRVPAVMLSGGREPAELVSYNYPGFKTLSRCGGVLECCKTGGCHRNHCGTTEEKQCKLYHEGTESEPTPQCMWSITPEEVIAAMREVMRKDSNAL